METHTFQMASMKLNALRVVGRNYKRFGVLRTVRPLPAPKLPIAFLGSRKIMWSLLLSLRQFIMYERH